MSCSFTARPEEISDVSDDIGNALLLFLDTGDELLRRQMCDVFFGPRVLSVQIAVGREQLGDRHPPCPLILLALSPPRVAGLKFFELQGLSLRVVLATLR